MAKKWLTVRRLVELLHELPDEWEVAVNTVGNLSVSDGQHYHGYIDFLGDGGVAVIPREELVADDEGTP